MKRVHGFGATKQTIRCILVEAFLYLSLFLLIIPGIILTLSSYERQHTYVSTNIQLISSKTAVLFDSFIKSRIQILENAAWLTDFASLGIQEQVDMLSRIIGREDDLKRAVFLGKNGTPGGSFSLLDRSGAQQFSMVLNKLREELLSLRTVKLGRVYIDEASNEPCAVISVPVFDVFRDFRGILVAELSLRFMWDFIGQVTIENGGYVYIVDSEGHLLAHPDLTRVLAAENVSELPIVSDFIHHNADNTVSGRRYNGINDEPVVGRYIPVSSTDWAIITEIPWNRSFYPIFQQVLLSAGIIIVAAFTSVMIGILLARRITVPLAHLTMMTTRISAGETNLLADLNGPREVSLLASSFNSMTKQLKKIMSRLESRIDEIKKTEVNLRQANTRLQVLIDNSPVAVVLLDCDGTVKLWSKAAESIYGWESTDVLGKEPPVVPPESIEAAAGFLHKIVVTKVKVLNRDFECLRKDGSRIWISLSVVPLVDACGKVYGIMNIVRDITEQKQDQEKILSSLKEKEALLKEIHHRVKNNMQIVSSMLNLQKEGIDNREIRDVFVSGQQRIQSMGIIHELLYTSDDFSRIDFSRYVESLSHYLLQSFSQDTEGIRLIADIAPISLNIETAVPCGLIINELLTNAMKHAFHGQKEKEIRVEMREDAGNITLTIGDNGVGIPFTANPGKRNPLGLILVQELVHQLHGSLEKEAGQGTVYHIVFPLTTAASLD